jgi:hypothetical protein
VSLAFSFSFSFSFLFLKKKDGQHVAHPFCQEKDSACRPDLKGHAH